MNRHAYLVMAHTDPGLLDTLLCLIDDARNDIFVHVDARADDLYRHVLAHHPVQARLFVLRHRVAVCWGDLSQVETEYRLFEAALDTGVDYAYLHLLSGADLPIQTQDTLHDFFRQHQGREFVGYWHGPHHERDLRRKVSRYYFFTRHLHRNHSPWHPLTAPLRNLALIVQKVTGLHRRLETDFRKGPNWCSLTPPCVRLLLAKKDWVMRRFRYTLCPDEIFVQTIVWNSPFRDRLFDTADALRGSQRLVDWERGTPYTFAEADFAQLCDSPLMFARKFTSVDCALPSLLRGRYGR